MQRPETDNHTTGGRNFSTSQVGEQPDWYKARDKRYREYRRLWDERPQTLDPGDFPLHLDIETTNLCNLSCVMCPRTKFMAAGNTNWSPDGLGRMDFSLYTSLIDEAAAEGAYSVKLNLLGEPLMHPQVVEQVGYASDKGLYVMMNTNATLLAEKLASALLGAGVDDVFFSIDSADRETYERIRPGANYEEVTHNIKTFNRLKKESGRKGVRTRAAMVTDVGGRTTPQVEIVEFQRLMMSLGVDEIGYGPEDDGADHTPDNMKVTDFVCEQPYQRMFITWDGQVVPCCGHWERGLVMGSVNEDGLKSIWQNARYKALRKAHQEGRFRDVSICKSCHVPCLDQLSKEDEKARS